MSISGPLNWREEKAIRHFKAKGISARPKGCAGGTIFSLVQRKLIIQVERREDFGPEEYRLTAAGMEAVEQISK